MHTLKVFVIKLNPERVRYYKFSKERSFREEKQEYKIREKALQDPKFPSEEVISEFLSNKSAQVPQFVWLKPSLPKFTTIADTMLSWEESYTREKMVPLLTRWHLSHNTGASAVDPDSALALDAIVKRRTVRGVASYELRWHLTDVGEVTSVEPLDLVARAYPDVHETFVKSKEKPKKGVRGRKKKTTEKDLDNVENMLKTLDINENKNKKPNKKRVLVSNNKGLQAIDKFFLKTATHEHKMLDDVNHSTPIKQESLLTKKEAGKRIDHYFSDESDIDTSPKIEERRVLRKSKSLENICKESLSLSKNILETEKLSNFPSFLNTTVDSCCDFDLSEIVNSIVTRRCPNPALSIWANQNS